MSFFVLVWNRVWGWGCLLRDWYSHLGCSKMDRWMFPKLVFFIMTTHNDHPSYAKHVLGIIYVFFLSYFGIGCGAGGVS